MKIYCDYENIYKFNSDGISMMFPIVDNNDELIITGTHIAECICDKDERSVFYNKFKISFMCEENSSVIIKFYCVPFVDIFAYDDNGYYCTLNDFTDASSASKIIYIDKNLVAFFVADNFNEFVNGLLNGTFDKKELTAFNDLQVFESVQIAEKHLQQGGAFHIKK